MDVLINGNKAGKSTIRNICVYCGSGLGKNPAYAEAARVLGRALAESGDWPNWYPGDEFRAVRDKSLAEGK